MRKIYIISFILLLGFLLVGCNKGSDSTTKDTDGSEGEINLSYWYWSDNSDYSELMEDIIKEFNETNDKGITVKGEEYPWDGGGYSESLFTAAVGGGGPDVAAFKLTSAPLFTANNLLTNLDDFIANWEDEEDIDQNLYSIMKEASGTDSIYVMPWNTQVLYVYYRPSIFAEAGVEVPTTYEEFLTAVEKTTIDTNGDGKTDIYGFGMRGSTGGHEPWGSFIHARGGSFEDMNSPESIEGMQDYVDIYKNGYAPPTAITDGFNEVITNFKSGTTAMTIHHTGSAAEMVETFGDDVSAFTFPGGKGQWTSMGDTENVVFESTEHKEAAFEWVAYLATGKGQERWTMETGNVPVSSRVQEMDYFQEDEFMKASIDGVSIAGIVPIGDKTTEWINSVWPNTIASALLGDQTVEEVMEKLYNELYEE